MAYCLKGLLQICVCKCVLLDAQLLLEVFKLKDISRVFFSSFLLKFLCVHSFSDHCFELNCRLFIKCVH